MAEDTPTPESTDTPPELTLESVDSFDPENLEDDQKTFLEEHKAELTPEQQEKFGIKAEEPAPNPDEIEPEVRGGKPKEDKPKNDKPGEGEEEDEDVDPEDEKKISKVVEKKLGGVGEALKEMQSIKDQNEVNAFIRQNPTYAKYEGVALKYMAHPAYKNIPVKNIMAMVASNDLMKMGAQKEREAAKKAKETQGAGLPARKQTGGKPDYKNMSSEEFAAEKNKVLQGPR